MDTYDMTPDEVNYAIDNLQREMNLLSTEIDDTICRGEDPTSLDMKFQRMADHMEQLCAIRRAL